MKKTLYIIVSLIMAAAAICSCQKPILVTGVTLDSKSMTMVVGDVQTLVATVSPVDAANTNVIWSSSNSTVAKVSNGTVSALGPGTAQVSVKTDDGCFTDVCTVTVVAKEILPTSIKLAYPSIDLLEGESAKLAVAITPDNSTDKSIVWTTSDSEVAVVTDGVVTALKAGTAEIVATTCNGLEAKCTVTVTCKVSGVALDYPTITLEEGETQQLTAKVYPSRASNLEVSWESSDTGIALVSNDGLVKGVKAGTATITVKTADGDFTDECEVIVKSRVADISLSKAETSLYVGDTETLTATITPANASDKAVNWYSEDESIAKVSANGQITGVKAGKTVICATTVDGGKHAQCEVTVYNHVSKVSLDKAELLLYVGGEGASLKASVLPEDAPDRTVSWESSDAKVATVDANGNVSPVAEGTAVITVKTTDLGLTASCKVTVKKIVLVESLTLSKTEARIDVGATLTLTATVSPKDVTDGSLTWSSSDATVASVDQNGKVTGKKAGKATITVKANDASGKTATCVVTVGVPVTGVSFNVSSKTINRGETYTITATITPSNATDKTLQWATSDPTVATVTDGKVTGVKSGKTTITATNPDSGKSATCTITVTVKVDKITLSDTKLTLTEGESKKVTATVTPADAENPKLKWSSKNEAVATVSEDGTITAVGEGTVIIRADATDGSGKYATVSVTVKAEVVPIEKIVLDKTSLKLKEGATATLKATVYPTDQKTASVQWISVNSNIASVDDNGVVTAVSAGSTKIKVVASDDPTKFAECSVDVLAPVKVDEITLDKTSETLAVGGSVALTATVAPADAEDKSIAWSSSNTSVATVDQNGVVTAKAVGSATITAKSKDGSNVSATCTITVVSKLVPVKGIDWVNNPPKTLYVGDKQSYASYVKINPSDATNKNIIWQVQQGGVLTLKDGIYTANKEGQCNVIAKTEDGGYTCTITVTVKAVSVTGVSISKESLSLKVGTSQQLTATVLPDNATNKGVTWKSSNPGVATVTSGTGIVKAISKGTATITVTTSDGNKKATCNVTVYTDPTGGESEGVDFEDL